MVPHGTTWYHGGRTLLHLNGISVTALHFPSAMSEHEHPHVNRTRADWYDVKNEDYSVKLHGDFTDPSDKSQTRKKTLEDKDGNVIFTVEEYTMNSLLQKHHIHDHRTNQLYTLRRKGSVPCLGRGTLLVFRADEKDDSGVRIMESRWRSV